MLIKNNKKKNLKLYPKFENVWWHNLCSPKEIYISDVCISRDLEQNLNKISFVNFMTGQSYCYTKTVNRIFNMPPKCCSTEHKNKTWVYSSKLFTIFHKKMFYWIPCKYMNNFHWVYIICLSVLRLMYKYICIYDVLRLKTSWVVLYFIQNNM